MAEQKVPLQTEYPKEALKNERRAWVRFPSSHEISCQPTTTSTKDEAETGWLGRVRDVSLAGIGLSMSRRFEPGTLLIVELSAKSKGVARPLPVQVVHATPETRGRWIIGCTFASSLSREELQSFLLE